MRTNGLRIRMEKRKNTDVRYAVVRWTLGRPRTIVYRCRCNQFDLWSYTFFRVPSHWSSLPRVTSHVFEGIRGFWKCFVLITLLRIRLEKLPSKHLDLTFDSCRHVNCEDTETREKMPPSESEDDVLDETPQFYHNEKKTIYIRFVLVARGENDRPIN